MVTLRRSTHQNQQQLHQLHRQLLPSQTFQHLLLLLLLEETLITLEMTVMMKVMATTTMPMTTRAMAPQ